MKNLLRSNNYKKYTVEILKGLIFCFKQKVFL